MFIVQAIVYMDAIVELISNILPKASSNKHKLCQATSEKVLIPDLQKKTSYML